IPKLPETVIELPEGSVKLPDGTVHLPEGAAIPEGATKLPDGNVKLPEGATGLPEGSVKLPTEAGAPARYYDPPGNLLDENGNVLKAAEDAPKEPGGTGTGTPGAGSDVPHTPSPAREPALVGAGTHTAGTAGRHINLGNSLDTTLGDIGRTGDHATTPVVHAGGDLPTVHAGDNLPGTHLGDNLPGSTADHLPGGHAGDNVPGGSAREHGTGPSASHEPSSGHNDGPGDGTNGHPNDGGHGEAGAGGHESAPHGHGSDTADVGHGEGTPGHGSDHSGGHTGDGGTPHEHTDHGGHEADPRDVREPRGSLVDDAARRAAEPIQIGDHPMPAPAAGENSLGQLPESRVQRDADGLITHVDGRNFEHFLKDLSFQRGAAFREAKELGTLSRRQVGACAGQVMDLRTGNIIEGINGKGDNVIPPDRVHPTLAANLEALPDPVPGYDHPLGHAEVKAVNELLWERTKLGLPDGPSALGELRAAVEFPYTPHMETQLPGRPAPFCVNCHHMLKDVDSLHGRFTGKDADDSNWIP
ncbi:YwqJ-related putative deaminase, partial [Streptomyces sp. NPDC000345]|uniref:YwqJ-related putative deaminase n=1 Tax=Streptomyces sp. NPDC000345 TaxID=3364537 RepID=UPI0036CEBCD7